MRPVPITSRDHPACCSGGVPLDVHRECCPADLAAVLGSVPIIEWHRVKALKDVSVRLLARQVLYVEAERRGLRPDEGGAYHPLEVTRQPVTLQPPGAAPAVEKKWHIYVSPNNPGAKELADELQAHYCTVAASGGRSSSSVRASSGEEAARSSALRLTAFLPGLRGDVAQGGDQLGQSALSRRGYYGKTPLMICTDPSEMQACQHFLLYLNTVTHDESREEREALYAEVDEAFESGVHVLLAHEMRAGRGGTTFDLIIEATPPDVRDEIDEAGEYVGKRLYRELAVGITDGAHLPSCLQLLLGAVAVVPDPGQEVARQARQTQRRSALIERTSHRLSSNSRRSSSDEQERGYDCSAESLPQSHGCPAPRGTVLSSTCGGGKEGIEERVSCDGARKLCGRQLRAQTQPHALRHLVCSLAAQGQAGDSLWSRLVFRPEAHVDAPAVVLGGRYVSGVRLGACSVETSELWKIES